MDVQNVVYNDFYYYFQLEWKDHKQDTDLFAFAFQDMSCNSLNTFANLFGYVVYLHNLNIQTSIWCDLIAAEKCFNWSWFLFWVSVT